MATIEISKVNSHLEVHSHIGDSLALLQTFEGTDESAKKDAREFAEKFNQDELGGVAKIVEK